MRRFKIEILLLAVMLLAGCGTINSLITPTPLTPKQQAIVWGNLYNQAYAETMATAKNPAATTAQKSIAMKKKAVLIRVWPLLKSFNAPILDNDGLPTGEIQGGNAATTAAIGLAFTELSNLSTGGGK